MHWRTWLRHICPGVLLLCLVTAAGHASDAPDGVEHRVKAAFLYNFIRFIEWPDLGLSDFRLCVYGDNPFGEALDQLHSRSVGQLGLMVDYPLTLGQVTACQLVFISVQSETGEQEVINYLYNLPVLTVSETPNFIRHGGMIGFVLENGKVRFEINPNQANEAGLTISSKLLRLATRIHGGD